MVAVVAYPKALPEQVRHALGGPDGTGEAIAFRASHQQAGELGQLGTRQLGRASGAGTASQASHSVPAVLLCPLMNGLPTHAQSAGDGRQRFPTLKTGEGGQAAGWQRPGLSSMKQSRLGHAPSISPSCVVSSYLCRDL
jgi:hypothetical protein